MFDEAGIFIILLSAPKKKPDTNKPTYQELLTNCSNDAPEN
jgi:hypothetical protein